VDWQLDTALACEKGHVVSRHLEALPSVPKFCDRCGSPTISKCPHCKARILGDEPSAKTSGDGQPADSRPLASNCSGCGKPLPWHAVAIERAKRVAAMQADLHSFDPAVTKTLDEFVLAVAEDRATPEETATFSQWLRKKTGPEAVRSVGGVLKEISSSALAETIEETMLRG
jgi:hypothetical protein